MRIQCLESLAAAEDAAGDPARAIQIRNEEDGLNAEKLRKSPSDLGGLEIEMRTRQRRGSSYVALRQWQRAEVEFDAALKAAEGLKAKYPKDMYFHRDLAEVCEDYARFRAAQARAGAGTAENLKQAREFAARAEKLWGQWAQMAVSSAYDQGNLRRVSALSRELERTQ